MPKYKVGDVAALFSKPKEPTTEAGKKLESLFKEFHAKKNKHHRSSYQNAESQTVSIKREGTKAEIVNERSPKKNKKRKFTDIESFQSSTEKQNVKKFKEEKPKYMKNSMPTEKKNKFPTEQCFPRKKNFSRNKFIKNFNDEEADHANDFNSSQSFTKGNDTKKSKKTEGLNDLKDSILSKEVSQLLSEEGFSKNKKTKYTFGANNFDEDINDFEEAETVHSHTKQESDNLKSKNKKQKAIFIKKSKKTEIVTSNHNNKNKDSENSLIGNSKFKNKDFNKKNLKDLRKCNDMGSKQNSQSPKVCENENKKEHNEISNIESFKDDNSPSKKVIDFVRNKNFKRKIDNNNNFSQKSEQDEFAKGLDFIKIPDIEPEDSEDELSRTLFVGNLPLDAKKKALKELFSSFGEIDNIRFHGSETDKAKIFSENGSKSSKLIGINYAADSVHGYIVYKRKKSAVLALSLSGTLFKGHHITVDFASPAGSHKLYDEKRSIFIGNLPFGCKDDNIWELFSECGRIESVRIVRDKKTGIGKGFGFVQFNTVQSKDNAVSLKNLEIEGRQIRVQEITDNRVPKKKTSDIPAVKRNNTFKSHAIRLKMKSKDSTSRKSVTKIMKKQKKLQEKKKISSILQKSMKK